MPHLDDFIIGRLCARRRLAWQWALAVACNPPIPRWKLELNRKGCSGHRDAHRHGTSRGGCGCGLGEFVFSDVVRGRRQRRPQGTGRLWIPLAEPSADLNTEGCGFSLHMMSSSVPLSRSVPFRGRLKCVRSQALSGVSANQGNTGAGTGQLAQ